MNRLTTITLAALLLAPLAAPLLPPRRQAQSAGFVSSQAATNWEYALTSGNGKFGALVFGQPLDETIVVNHARLFMPLCEPLPPVDTASHLKEIRKMLADGEYQRAARPGTSDGPQRAVEPAAERQRGHRHGVGLELAGRRSFLPLHPGRGSSRQGHSVQSAARGGPCKCRRSSLPTPRKSHITRIR